MTTKKELDELTYRIIGAAIDVHKTLGPGLLESVYHKCLKQEFLLRDLSFVSEFLVPVHYKGIEVDTELRCDFLVEDKIVVELKAVELIAPVFEAQTLTYMRLLEKPKGILINFCCANLFKEGQRTFVNDYFRNLPEE
jgi:GxxExxY protein